MCLKGSEVEVTVPEKRPIEGFRWLLLKDSESSQPPLLRSPIHGTIYKDAEAEANHTGYHKAPKLGCVCGIYGLWTHDDALRYWVDYPPQYRGTRVLVKFKAWGKVIKQDNGFKAQYIRITEVDNELAAALLGVAVLDEDSLYAIRWQ